MQHNKGEERGNAEEKQYPQRPKKINNQKPQEGAKVGKKKKKPQRQGPTKEATSKSY